PVVGAGRLAEPGRAREGAAALGDRVPPVHGARAGLRRRPQQRHARLLRGATALALVARAACGDRVRPGRRALLAAGHHVVDRGGRAAAVRAGVAVATQHTLEGVRGGDGALVAPAGVDVADELHRAGPLVRAERLA